MEGMVINMKHDKKPSPKKHPSEYAFLKNPVASNQDATGYVPPIPQDEFEADSYSDLFDIPTTSKFSEYEDYEYNRNTHTQNRFHKEQ